MNAECDDDNEKIVIRIYKYGKTLDKIQLCNLCRFNPIFDGYVSESKIEGVLQK